MRFSLPLSLTSLLLSSKPSAFTCPNIVNRTTASCCDRIEKVAVNYHQHLTQIKLGGHEMNNFTGVDCFYAWPVADQRKSANATNFTCYDNGEQGIPACCGEVSGNRAACVSVTKVNATTPGK